MRCTIRLVNQLEICCWSDSTCYNHLSYVSYGKKMLQWSEGMKYTTENDSEVGEQIGTLPALPTINELNKFKL